MHKLRIKKVRHVDHISEADADNDKCKLLNFQVPAIDFSGGGTHTADALKQAEVSCACVGRPVVRSLCSHLVLKLSNKNKFYYPKFIVRLCCRAF